jgi:hypothetical protein
VTERKRKIGETERMGERRRVGLRMKVGEERVVINGRQKFEDIHVYIENRVRKKGVKASGTMFAVASILHIFVPAVDLSSK